MIDHDWEKIDSANIMGSSPKIWRIITKLAGSGLQGLWLFGCMPHPIPVFPSQFLDEFLISSRLNPMRQSLFCQFPIASSLISQS